LPDQQFANPIGSGLIGSTTSRTSIGISLLNSAIDLAFPTAGLHNEDTVEFFTGRDLSRLGALKAKSGNMDYGKKDPSLGWRYTDAFPWLASRQGEPNGLPVDEYSCK
jgi:glycerol transport system substrate-binding protein